MRTIIRFKWLIAVVVLLLAIGLTIFSPNLTQLASEKGQTQLPEDAVSIRASEILENAGENSNSLSAVFVLDEALNEDSEKMIQGVIDKVEKIDGVNEITTPLTDNQDIQDQMTSEDKKTVMMPITVEGSDEEIEKIADEIYEAVPEDTTAYVTGASLINQDFANTSEDGLKKTELITVFIIVGLLLVVFRSIVTPFVPLITVGITYLISQGILAILVDTLDFPISTFTQTFLVAILFGIGTDYCILLLSRFREELANGHGKVEATVTAYRTAGRTLLISAIAVFVGFASIFFAKFAIFQSAVGVAVGVAVLLIVLVTVLPLFMVTLGEKLFWPSKKAASHGDNKLWHFLGRHSVARPVLFLAITAVITVPFVLTYDEQVSFNSTEEISSDYKSIKGLNAIGDAIGKGEAMPIQIVIKDDENLTTSNTLPYLDPLSDAINKIDHVEKVRTATQPTGDKIDDLYVDAQNGQIADGINDAVTGIGDVQDGLTQVQDGLNQITGQAGNAGGSSGGGLSQATEGLGQVNTALQQVSTQLQQTGNVQQASAQLTGISQQLGEIQAGLEQANTQLQGQQEQVGTLTDSLQQLADGVGSANEGLTQVSDGLTTAADTLQAISDSESVRDTGMYIPEDALEGDFQESIDTYAFNDGEGVTIDVVLDADPYSEEAIRTLDTIKERVSAEVEGTPYENAEIVYVGVTSTNADLEELSTTDLSRTMVIMMVGLFLILTLLFRSMIIPAYMIGSLLLTYYTAISITELIFVNGLDYAGVSWAVPFFSFVILISLGVDYSIFLLDRFTEEARDDLNGGMIHSMKKMGSVIITASIILAGTFAAMMPSGVLTLLEVATVIIIGLLLYGLVILPLLIPAIAVTLGELNWWPFKRKRDDE
ncbi:MMPL family transporter [Terribacillus halophilus]|uniref:MMPL family transporter n=1 Tax=Terribacillus halophilus TaxID=361279 RepID=UPI0009853E46|nr:MMPL family transporter [Terribacillus halophilus]